MQTASCRLAGKGEGASFVNLFWLLVILPLFLLGGGAASADSTSSKGGRFLDNNNGTITDTQTGLMWAKADSWNDLGKCLNWEDARTYVKNLTLGGFKDWRLPTMNEIAKFPQGIVERAKTNSIGAAYKNWKSEYSLNLDTVFADGAAYWIWSSETDGDTNAGIVDLRNGAMLSWKRSSCFVLGVRAVRNP